MPKMPANLEHLMQTIAVEVSATEAAAFVVETDFLDGFRINTLLHLRAGTSDDTTRSAAVAAFKELLAPCVHQANDGVIEIEGPENRDGKQFCLVALAQREQRVTGAATFIVRCRDEHDAQIALMHVQRAASGL